MESDYACVYDGGCKGALDKSRAIQIRDTVQKRLLGEEWMRRSRWMAGQDRMTKVAGCPKLK